ncbi:unnamed protein product [Adineta steineri]|uniref:Uncharacterized protein n=1 Tax=Adineta steineri TaxID=433720 RepID=A0A819LQ85_9BILA|nr:unnamed protein product [Adineta steineri]CAF3964675.1 unnamed protein product [Adineta steineri]
MMIRIDDYMKGLSSFRHATLVSIENFEKELHQFLLNSIRESIKNENTNNQLASQAISYLNSQNNNYDKKISMYKNIMEVFNNSIPSEVIESVKLQLENTNHSHSVYLQTKINDLTAMLNRFSKVEKLLPKFSKLFRKCLNDKYDHLSEQEVFSTNGKIEKDIFDYLKHNKNYDDIKNLVKNFNNTELSDIVRQCEIFVEDNDEKATTEISQCLRQCIIDTVENYTTSLLTYRHEALIAFNHFEKNLHDLLSSYEIIRNKNLRDSLKQILGKFNELPNDANNDYYNRSLEVYRNFVNTINLNGEFKECASVIKEILKENNHTLKPYFKEKINNIKNLLNSYINWYQIKTLQQNECMIYEIETTSAIVSEVLNCLKKPPYLDCFRPNNEIRIINSNKLYIDTDLSSPEYSGVNIALVSLYQELVNEKKKFLINTNGEDAKDIWNNNPAQNGIGTDQNRNGNRGEDGSDGKSGKSAGHVYIVANELPKIDVSACGGKGGRGQNGGNGAPGADGQDGKDADKEAVENIAKEDQRLYSEWGTRNRRIGTDSEPGSSGGDAGSGGFLGEGGNLGLVKLIALNNSLQEIPYKNLRGDPGSNDGKPGKSGEAGKHGKDGLDYVAIGKWGFFKREIHLKGGRLRPCDRYDFDEESQLFKNYSMLPMESDKDHFRFKSKYDDENAQKGADKSHKHKNQESVQKIHAINCEDVFQATSQFFSKFNNPQKLSYQHWLAPNLNQFLEKMARLEGLPPSEIYSLPDIEHDAKEILIVKQKFTETINIENQRLNSEKINTEQMSIGINLLGQEILGQYNDFLQQYQIVYQQLQKEIQKVDVNQLTTGLEIRSIEIAEMRNAINRIINEQRFNQRLIASQRRTNVLIDNPQEKLSKSILDRQNIKILQEEISKQEWKNFPIENNIIHNEILEKFNKEPNEQFLLEINCHFLFELENILSQNNIKKINRNHISNFTNIYLYNLQQGNFTFENLEFIEKQKQLFFQILPEFKSLENTYTLDLLIEFCKGMQRECLRHYWLMWINKTLKYSENKREIKENLLNLVNKIRVADENQLQQFDDNLKSSVLLREFPDYDFNENLYEDNRLELIESIDKFNEDSNQENLFQIFQTFSNSMFFDENHKNVLENLLANIEQLTIIQDFLNIFQHNLNLMNIHKDEFHSLMEQIVKIEKILIQYPRSYFHDIIFDFAINIMRKNTCLTPDKIEHIYIIEKSKDLSKLFTFQTSEVCERKTTFTVKQQIAAFKTLYDPTLVEEILRNLSTSSDINNSLEDEELNKFFQWIVNHLNDFDNKTIENILKTVENILQKQANNNNLQFLKIVLNYKITKSDIEKQKQEIELIDIEKEKSVKEFISIVEKCNNLFLNISKNNEIACQFYMNLMEIIHFTEFTNFQEVSDKILCNTRITCKNLLNNLSQKNKTKQIYQTLCDFRTNIPNEMQYLIDEFPGNIEKTIQYLRNKINNIDTQQNIFRTFKEKKFLSKLSDKLFFNIENLGNNIRILIANKLNSQISPKQLYFCIFMNEIYQKIGDHLYFYFKDNNPIKLLFENEFERYFDKHQRQSKTIEEILSNLAIPLIDILNLYQFYFDGKINESFTKTIKTLQNIEDEKALVNLKEQVLIDLLNSYPIFNNELNSIKSYIDRLSSTEGKQVKNYENILAFLYGGSNGKSEYIKDIYKGFYKYCQTDITPSNFQKENNLFNSLIQLMMLISITHQDILYINITDINHTQFQGLLLHVLFEEGYPLGDISEETINFLSWLFQTLSTYESIENIEDVEIEVDQIEQLRELSTKVEKLRKNKSDDDSDQYEFLSDSISTICQEMKSIYTQKHLKIISEKYPNAIWVGVIIHFPEYFVKENIDKIFNLIPKAPESITDEKLNKIQDIIFQKINLIQEEKLKNLYEFILIDRENDCSEFRQQLENVFKKLNGFLIKEENTYCFQKINPYHVLNFNNLLDIFNNRLEKDGNLIIDKDIFIKIQQCLCCFQDIRLVIEKLSSSPQNEWLKTALVEHILEKFSFIFPHEKEIEDIRNMLMQITEKLLLLFNNVLVTQYSDQIGQAIYSKKDPIPDYNKINKEKFVTIVNLLGKIPTNKEILDQLSAASLAVWDTLLYEMEFSQIFSREMNKSGINLNEDGVEKALLFLNRVRVKLGIENNNQFLDFFRNILEKISQTEGKKNIKELNELLQAIHYQEISFEQASKIISTCAYESWHKEVEKLKAARYVNTDKSDRSADEIIKQMIEEQKSSTNVISKETLKKIAKETKLYRETAKKINVLEGDEKSYISREVQNILNLSSYQNSPEEYIRSHLNDIIPLILYTWSIANKPQFPKDTQIIALLLFIHSQEKGLLEQVRTGEGKTLIVGIAAAFFALCGNAVDIVSSNRDLAIDGEKKCRSFFQLLKIESGHICSEDDDVNRQSYRPDLSTYQGNIVYGEVGAFQRDILEEEFNNKKIFGNRQMIPSANVNNSEISENGVDLSNTAGHPGCDPPVTRKLKRNKCLIVDEADNMCLDKARHVLYLSHEIQSLKWLETLFIFIWTAVNSKEIENSSEISQGIKDISERIKRLVENKHIFIPDYMKDFVDYKIKRWVDSAFQARIMREDDHFVLDISKIDEQKNKKQKNIIVLDKDTGVEQYSTRWSHGLAQFLELKYRRKLSVESLKAVFISNKTFFQRYQHRLYGLTGTIGSENSQNFLSDLYQLQFAYMPTSKEKYFYQRDNKISIDYGDWLDLIARETIEKAKKRPVLIICENVESTENIWNELIRHSVPHHTITKYRRDGDNVEERFQKKPATIGDIIIATNKGGRGTDIHVDPHVNKDGGMHVILSYLPENIRVEEQAFGRTGRNGAQGSGQFILLVDKSMYEEMYELNQYTKEEKRIKLENLAEIIIEKEKIHRDNKEAARLSELKQKNILHLEVEEELFTTFNDFKNKISKEIFQPLFNDKSEKSQQKFIDAFENVLKNRWAFWLDKVKKEVDAIENFQQKSNLLKEFKTSFIEELKERLDKASFEDLLSKFIDQPEDAIHIGKVCISENEISMAKLCFQKGIEYGDISGFSHIALTYCIITLKEGNNDDIKKQSRRELKQALYSLELIKRNLMSNLKIAEFLSQSATADILQKVSSKENFYQDQITGKLEVIGLQLHYLDRAVGNTVEPFDFILHASDRQNLTKEDSDKGEELYNLLVNGGIIQGDQIRKSFKRNKIEMEKIIRDNLDPSIADEIIKLLQTDKNSFKKKDFEDIVCYNEELWEILKIKSSEKVYILHKHRIEKELVEKYENIWKELEEQINVQNVNISLFENSIEKKNLKTYLEEKQILIQTKRVEIEQLDLKSLNLPEKYSKIKFNDNGHETKDLKAFLIELVENIKQQNNKYLYQTDLPFSTKEEEGNKIRIFLKDKNVLKSGGLAIHKYGDTSKDIEKELNKILKNTEFANDTKLILSKILNLQGDIRSYKDDLKANLNDFIDLKDQELVPSELKFFEGLGLDKFLIIEEDKSWWDWRAFAVAMIGLAQVIVGAALITFGLVNIGGALIAEGISDMVYATMAGLSGNFSWKDWAIQKAISLSLSIMSAGLGKLASTGSTAAKLGSVSRAAMISKIVGKAGLQFATTCLTNIITEKIMEQIQDGVIQKVVSCIEEMFLKGINESIKNKVEILYINSKNNIKEFEKSFEEMKKDIEGALGRNLILPQQFDNIRVQVVSSLQNSYQVLTDGLNTEGLKKSNSKYAKIAANTIQATLMINKLWSMIQSILQFNHAYKALKDIIEGATNKIDKNNNRENLNDNIVEARSKQMNDIIKEYIRNKLTRELDRVIRQIVSGTLKRIGKAVGQIAKDMINSQFNGKNPVDVLKQANQNKSESQVSVEPSSNTDKSKNEKEEQAKRESLQNDVQNLKDLSGYSKEEVTNKDRPLGLADLKMLAQSKSRNIVAYNTDTGETEIIRPSGLRRIPALFKQSAKINYKADENGAVGHYFTGRGTETYTQINGRKDCMIIAYNESLRRTVNESMIQQERDKLYRHINRNRQEFDRCREEIYRSGRDAMAGGKQKPRPTSVKKDVSPRKKAKKQMDSSKSDGTYRKRHHEKVRLKEEENRTITRESHEAEHVVPYRVMAGNLDSKSKIPRDSTDGRQIENDSPAYYEQKGAHRQQAGTGSGAKATEYCKSIDDALRVEQNPSIAFQVATSEYASIPGFAENAQTPDGKAASNSYQHMLKKTPHIPLRKPDGSTTNVEVLNIHREEALAARFVAESRRYPTPREQKIIRNMIRFRKYQYDSTKRQKKDFS